MKSFRFALAMLAMILVPLVSAIGQEDKTTRPSPPVDLVVEYSKDKAIHINFSSPSVKGRTIWGSLVPYGKVWRTGANEATIFEVTSDVMVQGKPLPAGKYSLFTIPNEKEWTIIFNSVWDQWGSYKYDQTKDVLRVTTVPEKSPVYNERMKFEINDHIVSLSWENLKVGFLVN